MRLIVMIFTLCIWSLNIAMSQNSEGFQCENALCLSDHLNVTFNNEDVPLTAPLDFSCGITHNNIFFAFSPETNMVTIDVELDNCTGFLGLQAIIYKTQDCKEFQEILCVSPGIESPLHIDFMDGDIGEQYLLMIDGYQGEICDFIIKATGLENANSLPSLALYTSLIGDHVICQGDQFDLKIENSELVKAILYTWYEQEGSNKLEIIADGEGASVIGVQVGKTQVCVLATQFCATSQVCFDIEVLASPEVQRFPKVVVCEDQVNLCQIDNAFFGSGTTPDPFSQGWNLAYYRTLNDAENLINPLTCDQPLSNLPKMFFIRIENKMGCFSIESFEIKYEQPLISELDLKDFCHFPIELNDVVSLTESDDIDFKELKYYRTKNDADIDLNELLPSLANEEGIYWLRAITGAGCFTIDSFIVELSGNTEPFNWSINLNDFNGFIYVNVSIDGDEGPYVIEWEDGAINSTKKDLKYGESYTVYATNRFGCRDTNTIHVVYSDSYRFDCDNVSLSPNPALSRDMIRVTGGVDWQGVEMFSILGVMVLEKELENNSFEMPELASGIYFVCLSYGNVKCLKKIIVI